MQYLKTIPNLWAFKCSDRHYSGIPDIIGCYYGKFFAIELKRPGQLKLKTTDKSINISADHEIKQFINEGTRPIQAYTLAQIKIAQGHAIVADSLGDVKEFIEHLK